VGAVVVVVHGVAVVVDEIVPVHVVHEPVAVVVDAVPGDFTRVGPDVGRQVGVCVVDARIDHAHDDLAAAGGDVPGLGRVDVGVVGSAGLAGVVQAPEPGILRVVGDGLEHVDGVQLVAGDVFVRRQVAVDRLDRGPRAAHQHLADQPQSADDLELHSAADQQAGGL